MARLAPLVFVLLLPVLLSGCGKQPSPPEAKAPPQVPASPVSPPAPTATQPELSEPHVPHRTIQLNPDHPTYGRVEELYADADAVVVGTVTARRTQPPSKRSELPYWNYTVQVERTSRGSVGDRMTVAVLGGESPRISWVLVGNPSVKPGSRYLFYLTPDSGGKRYLLAGGQAVGRPYQSGWILPPGVSGNGPLRASADGSRALG